ncbi:hypothetical protein [Cytobacillus oceanisediminis]
MNSLFLIKGIVSQGRIIIIIKKDRENGFKNMHLQLVGCTIFE